MSVASSHSHSHTGTDASAVAANGSSAHGTRQRLGSVGDSVPGSDSSEGTASETFEHAPHWAIRMDDHSQLSSHQQQQKQQQHRHHQQMQQQQQHNAQAQRASYSLSGSHVSGSHHDDNDDERTVVTSSSVADHDDDDDDVGIVGGDVGLDSLSLEQSGVLSELERGQVESFFSGLGTEIFVCPSLANLYEFRGPNDWRLVYTGVPVLLHDKGSTRSRSLPRVTLVLAERGTCFALWQDTIDHLSEYKIGGPAFHTMCLSGDHAKLVGFSYDSSHAADETWHTVEKLVADPANIALSAPGRKRAAKQPKRPKPAPLPPKSQISAPCQFQHVTSVTAHDAPRYFSLQAFVNATAKHRSH